MGIQKDLGIVLAHFDFRETSRIATIYTKRFGKITGLFKGFYRHPDYFISTLDVFSLNEFIFYEKADEIWLVSSAYLLDDFSAIRSDFKKNIFAGFLIHCANQISPLHQPHPDFFNLLTETLGFLKTRLPAELHPIFLLKVFLCLGIQPLLSACIVCKEECTGEFLFSIRSGGVVCLKCAQQLSGTLHISGELFKVIEFILKNDFSACLRLRMSPKTSEELRMIIEQFLEYHTDINLSFERLLCYASY